MYTEPHSESPAERTAWDIRQKKHEKFLNIIWAIALTGVVTAICAGITVTKIFGPVGPS